MKNNILFLLYIFTISQTAVAGNIGGEWICKNNANDGPLFQWKIDEQKQTVILTDLRDPQLKTQKTTYRTLPLQESKIDINDNIVTAARQALGIQRIKLDEMDEALLIAENNGMLLVAEEYPQKHLIGEILGFYPHLLCSAKK